jgi:hypothetical protein
MSLLPLPLDHGFSPMKTNIKQNVFTIMENPLPIILEKQNNKDSVSWIFNPFESMKLVFFSKMR